MVMAAALESLETTVALLKCCMGSVPVPKSYLSQVSGLFPARHSVELPRCPVLSVQVHSTIESALDGNAVGCGNEVGRRGDALMQVIENWNPQGTTVYMDGKRYINCIFTECKIVYGGGDVMWENTQFVNCQLVFDAAAQRTVAYLTNLGLLKPPAGVAMPTPPVSSGPN